MKTIMLRFSDDFAPKTGTIFEHQKIIENNGFVWFGKQGSKVSPKITKSILKNGPIKILLVQSRSTNRYLATIAEISYIKQNPFPSYYENEINFISTWFKITSIEKAPEKITDRCILSSSGNILTDVIKKTMGSCFLIEIKE